MARSKVPYIGLKPSELTETQWRIVVDAWENGLSDREASFRVTKESKFPLKESELRKILKDRPEVAELRDFLHSDIISQAKLNIREKIKEGDIATSKWYLERKNADEFSTKAAVAFEGAITDLSIEEKEKKLAEYMKQFGDENEQ